MTLYVQILSINQPIQPYFLECFNRYKAEIITTLNSLSIWAIEKLSSYGNIVNELLYICKSNLYSLDISFTEQQCYITIRN